MGDVGATLVVALTRIHSGQPQGLPLPIHHPHCITTQEELLHIVWLPCLGEGQPQGIAPTNRIQLTWAI